METEGKNSKAVLSREEIPEHLTWRLEDIFSNDEQWEEEYKSIKELLNKAETFKGTLGKSAEHLFEALTYQDGVLRRLGKLYTYAHMRYDQDTTNSFYQGMNDRAKNLFAFAGSALAFIVPEILAIDEQKLQQFLQENEDLALYEHALRKITLQRPHVLSTTEEALLAQASEVMSVPSNVYGMLNNADLKFPSIKDENGEVVEITHGRFISLLESDNRHVRRDAFKKVYETYGNYQNTFASTLSGQIKKDNFNARIRNYRSARHAALSSNNIPENVYDLLVDTVNKHLPLLHRYIKLRKKTLALDELHMYDLYTPLVKEMKIEIDYERAKELVLAGLEPLGKEYSNILKEAFENRWIDVMENRGKRSGAYSSGTYGTNPYVLLNWQDDINNLFTLAHELGHSVHSYYTRKTQPFVYGNYSIFVAEVASTCNEALLNNYLLQTIDDKKKRIYLLNHYLEGFRGTVFRQTMFAEFEHLIHEMERNGESLTANLLTKTYTDLNKKYFGNDIHIDKEIGLEWARIPHFYYNYYVYQYATGFSAAIALSKKILEEGQPAVEKYINFLKSGSSDYPIEVLKKAGVDMTTAAPIEAACKVFEETLDKLEDLLS